MNFKELTRKDDTETGDITLSITVSKEVLKEELEKFYSTVAKYTGMPEDASWDEIDEAATRNSSVDAYREIRRDFVNNRISSASFSSLNIKPALTPNVHALEYPNLSDDYSIELSVVEKPCLILTSYEPVEIETNDIEVTDDLIDAKISTLLESRSTYTRIDNHPVMLGDIISIDIATSKNGTTVPHLTEKKRILELSDGSMPSEFVGQLLGSQVGETRTINYELKRPRAISDDDVDTYAATVIVLEQLEKSTPRLTDDWVNDNIESASTVDEFRAGVAQGLSVEVESVNRDTHARLANNELEKRLQGKIPNAFYQASRNGLMDKLQRELKEKGQTIDEYYEQNETNEEELSVQMLIKSGENLRQGFALEALFEGRKMQLSDEDLRYTCEHMFGADSYDLPNLQQSGKYPLVESAAKRMVALNWLADTAIIRK